MDKLGVFLRLPKINLAPLTINSPTPSPSLVKNDILASFPPINSSLNTDTLQVKNDNSLTNVTHELAFKHHQNASKRLRKYGKENLLTPEDTLMSNSHQDEEIKEDESQDQIKDLKRKKFLKKGGGNSHIKKSNSLPKIIHHAHIDFKDPIQTNTNSQTKYFNRKHSKSSLMMIFNQKHEKRASLNLDRSINTLLTFSHDPQKNISCLHNETDSLSTTHDIQGINKFITDDKSDTQKNDRILNPSSSKKVNLNIGFDSLTHLAGTNKTIHISKLQGLNSHNIKLPTISSIPKPKSIPKVYMPALNSKLPHYSSKPNPLLDSMTESIPNSQHKNTQSVQSQTGSALLEKSYVTQDLGNGFESIQKMLKMCNIRELEKDFNPKNKKKNFLKQIGGQDPNFSNLLINSYLHINNPMTHNTDKLEMEKIKVGPRQKFNLKELNHDLTLLNNSNTISDKIKMNKGFKENKETTLIKVVDNMKLQIPIDLEKIMDSKFKFVKPITGERLKSITSGRKATSVDQTNIYTKRSTRPLVYMPKEMKKNENKIINESINHKNILPDFLKETDKADILKNMAKFIGEEVSIQDEKLDHLIDKYDTEFSHYEKS